MTIGPDDLESLDTRPDWRRWEEEALRGYLLRCISQAVWELGTRIGDAGYWINQKLWGWADRILDNAHPEPTSVYVKLGEGSA